MPRPEPEASNPGAVPLAVSGYLSRFKPGTRILSALSGGPDSVALLLAAVDGAGKLGLSVSACWVDHALRPAAELSDERAFVVALCRGLGVPLAIEEAVRGEIDGLARDEGGVEAAARAFRYAALERARVSARCDAVITGHSSDDFVETMVMRFLTGSGTGGLRGIPETNGRIGRPLLGVTKSQVLGYLAGRGQPFRTDSTNDSGDYLRNRVRREVLPVLYQVFPSLRASLCTVAAKASLDEEALAGMAETLLLPGGPGFAAAVDAAGFDEAPVAARIRALYRLAGTNGARGLPWRLVHAAAVSGKSSGRLASGAGVEFAREGGLVLARTFDRNRAAGTSRETGPEASGFGLLVDGPGDYRIGKAGSCRIYFRLEEPGLRLDAFSWPVWIRSRRPGDSMRTGGGVKMIDALLSELAVPAAGRDAVPVVEDRDGVVAILAARCGGRDVFRRNDGLVGVPAPGFLVMDMEGAAVTDAIRR